jgi:hypothetical protein
MTRSPCDKGGASPSAWPKSFLPRHAREDATRTQNLLFGIRNLRKPRELSQPNQLELVGERGFEPPTPWSRTRFSRLLEFEEIC